MKRRIRRERQRQEHLSFDADSDTIRVRKALGMQRIMVMGGPGSGKSTVARQLGAILDLPVTHLDRIFWKSGWVPRDENDFVRRAREIANTERWVIDGNYSRTLPDRLKRADTLVFLDLPLRIRLPRVIKRRFVYRNHTREDMAPGCPERIDWTFLKFVVQYGRNRRPRTFALLNSLQSTDIRVIHLRNSIEVEAFLNATVAHR